MQILALYVNVCMRESTSEEGTLSVAPDAVKMLFPPQLFEECKGVSLFSSQESQTQQEVVT